jgi:hypothetical protein
MDFEPYLRKQQISVSSGRYKPTEKHRHSLRLFARKVVDVFSFHLRFFTGLSLRLRADISKVTVHERIQQQMFKWGWDFHLYFIIYKLVPFFQPGFPVCWSVKINRLFSLDCYLFAK